MSSSSASSRRRPERSASKMRIVAAFRLLRAPCAAAGRPRPLREPFHKQIRNRPLASASHRHEALRSVSPEIKRRNVANLAHNRSRHLCHKRPPKVSVCGDQRRAIPVAVIAFGVSGRAEAAPAPICRADIPAAKFHRRRRGGGGAGRGDGKAAMAKSVGLRGIASGEEISSVSN